MHARQGFYQLSLISSSQVGTGKKVPSQHFALCQGGLDCHDNQAQGALFRPLSSAMTGETSLKVQLTKWTEGRSSKVPIPWGEK